MHQNILLLLASYFFYGWWSFGFLSLLTGSTLLDYMYGFSVASKNRKKAKLFLCLGLINNLGLLCVFKYYNFFAAQLQQGFNLLGLHANPVLLHVVLPIGISFYTFHGMSYIIDIYRGHQKPVINFIEYAVFVAFFPLLVAGPIERAHHLLPQIQRAREFDYTRAIEGCRLILWGVFKKVVIADNLAGTVNTIFFDYQNMTAMQLMLGAVAFSFQIYGDFSGYSDIALGTSKLLGFELLSNFRFPYFSRNVAEFWRRWHISLSSWFRDYLYIPLGGSRAGKLKTVYNTFVIFLVSGLWHGASWNFLAWGFIHACGFLPVLFQKKRTNNIAIVAQGQMLPTLKEALQIVATFAFVTLAWIFFRAEGMRKALDYIKRMIVGFVQHPEQVFVFPSQVRIILYIVPLLLLDWYFRRDERNLRMPSVSRPVRWLVYAFFIFLIGMFMRSGQGTFIYFQF